MKSTAIISAFFFMFCYQNAIAEEFLLNMVADGNLKYYDEHGCDETQIQVIEKEDKLLLVSYAFDLDSGLYTSEIEYGCELSLDDKRDAYSNYSGKCKIANPSENCPTCTSTNVNLSMVKFGDLMVISDPLSTAVDFSGIYKICTKK